MFIACDFNLWVGMKAYLLDHEQSWVTLKMFLTTPPGGWNACGFVDRHENTEQWKHSNAWIHNVCPQNRPCETFKYKIISEKNTFALYGFYWIRHIRMVFLWWP